MLVTVDTGGTKTLVAGFGTDGKIAVSAKFATPSTTSDYIEALRDAFAQLFGGHTIEAVIVALPGIVRGDVAVWCNHLGWRDFNVVEPLRSIVGDVPVRVENDANLAGLAEARALSPIPTSVLYVTISTGIGTGIITEGKIDPALSTSEGGRSIVEYGGTVLEWEQFASGGAIKEAYGTFAKDITASSTWDEIADRISRGFLAAIPLLQPEVIIIGGSIGTYFDRYADRLREILQRHLPAHISCPDVRRASHPEEAVIYGCYYYALDTLPDLTA